MAVEYIKIKRSGYTYKIKRDLTEDEKRNTWRRQKTTTETLEIVKAKIISSSLALFQYEKGTIYIEPRYHVIHIPTGLVIADITYDLMAMVKKTFERSTWTLKGSNTLVLYNDTIQFEMTCLIRYDIIEGM